MVWMNFSTGTRSFAVVPDAIRLAFAPLSSSRRGVNLYKAFQLESVPVTVIRPMNRGVSAPEECRHGIQISWRKPAPCSPSSTRSDKARHVSRAIASKATSRGG